MSSSPTTLELSAHLLPALPPSCHYIPSFLSPDEEASILSSIYSLPSSRWTQLTHRRLLSLPSPLTGVKRDTLLAAPLPPYLDKPILDRLDKLGVFKGSVHGAPNHVLVNEYRPGEGIMRHEDGGVYWGCTATVSLGGSVVLDVYDKRGRVEDEDGDEEGRPGKQKSTWRILQEPRSLLITSGEMYSCTLHGIEGVEVDENLNAAGMVNWDGLGNKSMYEEMGGNCVRETRVSLTYRDVVKVAKVGGAMKFLGGGRR